MPKSTKLYETLGIRPEADAVEIKKAFREKAKACHPDHYPNDKKKEEDFKEISIAYSVLSDPAARKRYDRTGEESPQRDDETARVCEVIIRTFQQVRAEAGEDIFYIDIFAAMSRSLNTQISNAAAAARKLRKHSQMIAKLIGKIKYDAGEQRSFLHAALAAERRDVRLAICAARCDIRIIKKAKQMLEGYTFDVEKRDFAGNYGTWMPFTTRFKL